MPNHAHLTIAGHLTKDAEVSTLGNGTAITRFDLAVNTGWGDNKQVTFYSCAMFGDRGPKVSPYLLKGKAVLVAGEPSLRKTTRDDGRQFTNLNVRVNEVVLLGNNPSPITPDEETVPF